jgi:diacylglycerol O-acyltransferase / wax synthase
MPDRLSALDASFLYLEQPTTPMHVGIGEQRARQRAVSVGVTSYAGGVYVGLNPDRYALPDVDALAQGLPESLGELVWASG